MNKECVLCSFKLEDVIYSRDKWRVILVDDDNYPGFCRVIWNEHIQEMTDLSIKDRYDLMDVVWKVEKIVRQVMEPDKINIASLGNRVPHLHWHIIPRYKNDRNFPDSVWSETKRSIDRSILSKRLERVSILKEIVYSILVKEYGAF